MMSQVEIPYERLRKEIIEEYKKYPLMIIATSAKNKVSAREMRFITDGLSLYCFTDHRTRKYHQITANPYVAVSAGNLCIEGVASLKGSPMDERNTRVLEVFRESQPDWHDKWIEWGHFVNPIVRLIEVIPSRITMFKMTDFDDVPESYFALLDVVKEKAYRLDPSEYPETPAYK